MNIIAPSPYLHSPYSHRIFHPSIHPSKHPTTRKRNTDSISKQKPPSPSIDPASSGDRIGRSVDRVPRRPVPPRLLFRVGPGGGGGREEWANPPPPDPPWVGSDQTSKELRSHHDKIILRGMTFCGHHADPRGTISMNADDEQRGFWYCLLPFFATQIRTWPVLLVSRRGGVCKSFTGLPVNKRLAG